MPARGRSDLLLMQVSVLRTENDLKIIPTERFAWSGLLFAQVSVLRTENDLKIISTERFVRSVLHGAACGVRRRFARQTPGTRAACMWRQAYSSEACSII